MSPPLVTAIMLTASVQKSRFLSFQFWFSFPVQFWLFYLYFRHTLLVSSPTLRGVAAVAYRLARRATNTRTQVRVLAWTVDTAVYPSSVV